MYWAKILALLVLFAISAAFVAPHESAFASGTAPANPAWQDDAGAAAAAPAPDPQNAAAAQPRKSMLRWLIDALGWGYILVFMSLSFVLVGLFILNLLSARREAVCPDELIEGFEALLDEKKYQEAYELAKSDESFLGNVLSNGLARLSSGYQYAVEMMQQVGQDESMKMQHRLNYLALIGTLSPMIGLFGTVHGMIDSFFEIATAGGSPDPNKLADGISKALLTTLIGLAIAIPAIAAFNILRNRFERLELEVGIASDNLMSRFEKVGQKKE